MPRDFCNCLGKGGYHFGLKLSKENRLRQADLARCRPIHAIYVLRAASVGRPSTVRIRIREAGQSRTDARRFSRAISWILHAVGTDCRWTRPFRLLNEKLTLFRMSRLDPFDGMKYHSASNRFSLNWCRHFPGIAVPRRLCPAFKSQNDPDDFVCRRFGLMAASPVQARTDGF